MQKVLRVVVILLVAFGTLTVLQSRPPEERTFTSDDGRVYLVGNFLRDDDFSIVAVPAAADATFTAAIAPAYDMYPPGRILVTPAQLYFHYDPDVVDVATLRIGFYDETFGMWRPMDTEIHAVDQIASASIDHFGRWALLQLDDVARPNVDAEMESLIASPPQGAVGYQLELGYADVPGDFVILPGAGKTGGCAGQYKTGESTQMTSRASVFSDHLEYQVVALWQIGEGCQGREVIE